MRDEMKRLIEAARDIVACVDISDSPIDYALIRRLSEAIAVVEAEAVQAEAACTPDRCSHPPCRSPRTNGSLCMPCVEWFKAHPDGHGPCDRCTLDAAKAAAEKAAGVVR